MAHFLMVIAAEGFRDEEYFYSKEELEKAGHKVTTASVAMRARGSEGGQTAVDILLKDIAVEDTAKASDTRQQENFDTQSIPNTRESKFSDNNVDETFAGSSVNDYDAIAFIGGQGSYNYFEDETAQNLAKAFYNNNKITSAICAAPGILAHSGLLEGKNFTSFSGVKELVESKGGHYEDSPVVQDGLIITSQGPHTAGDFGRALAKAVQ